MTPRDLLEQLNELDEHSRIEAKAATEAGKSALETVCAFANEPGLGGGWLLLGATLDEDALFRQYSATGLSDPDKVTLDLSSQCATTFNRPIRVQIEAGQVNGKTLLSVFVPEAQPAEKPIFFTKPGLPAGALRRIGSSDVHCTDDDLAVFYQDRRGDSFDGTVLRDADLSALDPAAIAEYRKLRTEANPSAEELRWNDEEMLDALRCVTRENGTLRPTVAGILLFGTPQALRRWFPMMRVDYIRVPGREWVPDPENRFETVEMRAPLVSLIRRSRAAILDDLPKAFSLPPGQLHRKDIPLVPDRVIREAVVNAIMHRSYRVQGAIQIIRYANRLEIRNPGHSLVSEDRLGEPGSETRNPVIAAILHDTNLAETKGSGIRVMRQLMDGVGLTPPTFESDRERNQFVVTLLFHHFLTPEDWEWLKQFQDLQLANEDARALVFVREAGAITNAAFRAINHVDVLTASQHLRRLRQNGLLQQKGKGAQTYYLPTDKLLVPWLGRGLGENSESDSLSTNLSTQSSNPETLSVNLDAQPVNPETQSVNLPHRLEDFAELPPDLRESLQNLKQRVSQPEMEALVLKLCLWRDLSTEDLAKLLDRNRIYISNRLLTPMLRTGALKMTIPDQPNHPQQRYRAVAPPDQSSSF
jgi:ATP-dependent DNA helicase RecG